MIIINTKVLRYITQTKALKMNGLQWLVWPWAYDQVGSLMDGWGSGAYEMRQYTHLANATISKNISYNILQILSLYFREAPFWKAIRVCGHCLFSTFNYIHVITLVCVRCQIFMRFNSSCFLPLCCRRVMFSFTFVSRQPLCICHPVEEWSWKKAMSNF